MSRLTARRERESVSTYAAVPAYINTHLEVELSFDWLEQEFYLRKYYITHLFPESVGLSVHQYITKKRLAACCDAIHSGAKISEAYLTYGFQDYSSFYRAFQKECSGPAENANCSFLPDANRNTACRRPHIGKSEALRIQVIEGNIFCIKTPARRSVIRFFLLFQILSKS